MEEERVDDTYIKLYRKCLSNRIFLRDHTAWHIFEFLLLSVDRKTGSYDTGRFQIANVLGLNPNTVYSALKRLQTCKMVNITSNNKYSVISIVNWHEYQTPSTPRSTQASTTNQQQINTKQEVKKKEVKNIDICIEEFEKVKEKISELQEKFPTKSVLKEYDAAGDWLESKGYKDKNGKYYVSYLSFFRTWLRNSKDTRIPPRTPTVINDFVPPVERQKNLRSLDQMKQDLLAKKII